MGNESGRKVFISHRHHDRAVAERLQRTLVTLLGPDQVVFNSSNRQAEGPAAGSNLGDELRHALALTSVVILLYTTDDGDWRWPFYECGVAMDPRDPTPTRTVVFDFQTQQGSSVFEGDKRLVLDEALMDDGGAPADFRQFIRDLVLTDQYLPARHPDREVPSQELLDREADELYADLLEVAPASQAKLSEALLAALTSVPPADRRRHFEPVFKDAARALQWGLNGDSARRTMFIDYWNKRLLEELKSLARRRLVFRPGRVNVDWTALLVDVCYGTYCRDPRQRIRELSRPILALVSHEAGTLVGDGRPRPLEFWEKARQPAQDPFFYEAPVRQLAARLGEGLGEGAPHPPVERTLVLARASIDPPFIAALADVVNWMVEGGLAVSIVFEDSLSSSDVEMSDFGIVGDIAVSRFEAAPRERRQGGDVEQVVDPTAYRSLVEEFDPTVIKQAIEAWQRLQARVVWRTPPEVPVTAAMLSEALST